MLQLRLRHRPDTGVTTESLGYTPRDSLPPAKFQRSEVSSRGLSNSGAPRTRTGKAATY